MEQKTDTPKTPKKSNTQNTPNNPKENFSCTKTTGVVTLLEMHLRLNKKEGTFPAALPRNKY